MEDNKTKEIIYVCLKNCQKPKGSSFQIFIWKN